MTILDGPTETITDGRLVTRELAEWVASLRFEDLPEAVVAEAGRAFADYLGECLFVGATKPWGRAIADFAAAVQAHAQERPAAQSAAVVQGE